jgi:iron(III) transport system substrate-binding protein
MKNLRTWWLTLGCIGLLIALPLSLRKDSTQTPSAGARRLVIFTPHSETIRQEFAEAFARHWRKSHAEDVYIDWRSPGGTSEIRLVLDASYKAADESKRAGIGADLFFGGGEPDFASQAKKGRLAPLQAFQRHPEWFATGGPIPEIFTGERLWAKDRTWCSSCLSRFGICWAPERWQALGLSAPTRWADLTDPKLRGQLALADPTKSGSVARTFELIIQAEMQRSLAAPERQALPETQRLALGWRDGLRLVQRLAANARYFSDSSTKVPLDVADGNAAAGMCVDYYGAAFAHQVNRPGATRLIWTAPAAGTTVSGDPIAVLRGAPEPELAQAFAEFVLSPEGQALWSSPVGGPHGPRARELFRPPVRQDAYASLPPDRAALSPYRNGDHLQYRPELTSAAFGTIRRAVRVMCIDTHEELKEAWAEIIRAGLPADALETMADVSAFPYREGGKGDPGLDSTDPLVAARRLSELAEFFRQNYRRAAAQARQHPTPR